MIQSRQKSKSVSTGQKFENFLKNFLKNFSEISKIYKMIQSRKNMNCVEIFEKFANLAKLGEKFWKIFSIIFSDFRAIFSARCKLATTRSPEALLFRTNMLYRMLKRNPPWKVHSWYYEGENFAKNVKIVKNRPKIEFCTI